MPILLPKAEHFKRLETICAHAGAPKTGADGAVVQPIYTTSTYRHAPDGTLLGEGYQYSRGDNPNRRELERVLTALEQGAETIAFGSGAAALHGVLAALAPGDHVLLHRNLYMGTRRLVELVMKPWGLGVTYADLRQEAELQAGFTPQTKLVWVETPSNPLLEGIDIAQVAQAAHAQGAFLFVDSTFATPVGQAPLALGADLVMHATTKFLGGHSDVIGGTVTLKEQGPLAQRIRQVQHFAGGVPAPMDCYLVLRGIRSLMVRYARQCANAEAVATLLEAHPAVAKVNYPGLKSHPDYALFQRQQYLPGAMLSFHLKGGEAAAMRMQARLKLWTIATSLGGTESLVEHRASTEGEGTPTPRDLIRMSVGLENVDDLRADLAQALADA